jgi:arabinogalactan oligomer/maltooligosaccharide transport system substrate-binding protein
MVMKIKRIMTMALVVALAFLFFANKTAKADEGKIKIWVGSESTVYYEGALADYKAYYKEKNGTDFPFDFEVSGVDTGAAAATFLTDTEAGADIFTVPHDNLGKLLDGSGVIAPITSEALIAQMEEQNSDAFLDVCYLQAGDGSAAEYYAVPYISQSLFLVYNKEVFAGKEDKLSTWEGILEVAKEKNALATAFQGSDGFNFSLFLLAQPKSDDAVAAFGKTGTLQMYKNGTLKNCNNYGDDQVALMKYAQRFICDPNGRDSLIVTNDGFATELSSGSAITAVIGAWNVGSVQTSLPGNWGAVPLPSFTLTEADQYCSARAGMEFYSGTFADCKAFVKKAGSAYANYLDDILLYLTSDAVQEGSFKEANNLPASKNATIEATGTAKEVADAQIASAQHGIAQPFGISPNFNQFYYSAGAPAMYEAIVTNNGGAYDTATKIKIKLLEACYVWTHGSAAPTDPAKATEKKPTLETWLEQLGLKMPAETDEAEYEASLNPQQGGNEGGNEQQGSGETPTPTPTPDPEPTKKGCKGEVSATNVILLSVAFVAAFGIVLFKTRKREE